MRRRFDWGSRPTSPEVRARPNTPADAMDAGARWERGWRPWEARGWGTRRAGKLSSVVCRDCRRSGALAAGLAQFAARGGSDFM